MVIPTTLPAKPLLRNLTPNNKLLRNAEHKRTHRCTNPPRIHKVCYEISRGRRDDQGCSRVAAESENPARKSLLRNSIANTIGGTNEVSAAKRRDMKARHGSAGKAQVEQTESASADGTFE